jgi:hypothetical protein
MFKATEWELVEMQIAVSADVYVLSEPFANTFLCSTATRLRLYGNFSKYLLH